MAIDYVLYYGLAYYYFDWKKEKKIDLFKIIFQNIKVISNLFQNNIPLFPMVTKCSPFNFYHRQILGMLCFYFEMFLIKIYFFQCFRIIYMWFLKFLKIILKFYQIFLKKILFRINMIFKNTVKLTRKKTI